MRAHASFSGRWQTGGEGAAVRPGGRRSSRAAKATKHARRRLETSVRGLCKESSVGKYGCSFAAAASARDLDRSFLDMQSGSDSLASWEDLPSSSDEMAAACRFNPELRNLCKMQLALMSSALKGVEGTEGASGVATTVYARSPASFETGKLELVQIASCGPAVTGSTGRAAMEGLERDSGILVLGTTSAAATEASLVSEDWIALPDGISVVMPLSWGPFLVGLMLVERQGPARVRELPTNATSGLAALGEGDGGQPEAATLDAFTEQERTVLLQVASSIAIACVMDQKATLLQAQDARGKEQMSGLIEDARGPLSAIFSLGTLLAPRLENNGVEQDMAEAMLVQGQRLKEVVQQLQTALRPQQAPEDAETSAASQIGSARAVSDVAYLPLAEGLQKLGIAEQLRSRTPQRSRSAGQDKDGAMMATFTMDDEIPSTSGVSKGSKKGACNAAAVIAELVAGASGVCNATRVQLQLGPGLEMHNSSNGKAADESQSLKMQRPVWPLQVAISADLLRSGMSQIIDSALQRTPPGGTVVVDASHGDGLACIWVSDSGGKDAAVQLANGLGSNQSWKPGLDSDAVSALKRISSRQPAGLGLMGTKIAYDTFSRAGGSLAVTATETGTVVYITLPLER